MDRPKTVQSTSSQGLKVGAFRLPCKILEIDRAEVGRRRGAEGRAPPVLLDPDVVEGDAHAAEQNDPGQQNGEVALEPPGLRQQRREGQQPAMP